MLNENLDTKERAAFDARLEATPDGGPRPDGQRGPRSRNVHQLMSVMPQAGGKRRS